MGGGGFFIVGTLFLYVVAILLRFSPYGGLFSQYKVLFAPFFPCRGVFATFVSYGGLFSPFKSLSFFLYVGAFFATFFLLMGGHFYRLKAFLLFFSLCGGLFARFSCGGGGGGGLFPPFENLSATFFSMWGCCFMGTLFSLPPP